MKTSFLVWVSILGVGCAAGPRVLMADDAAVVAAPATEPSASKVVELVPSEDPKINDFHSLGLIEGRVDIFRCSSPVHDLHSPDKARAVYQHMYDLGIRTVISLEDPNRPDEQKGSNIDQTRAKQTKERYELEKQAAADVGITFVNHPMNNAGPNSLQTMSDAQVQAWLDEVSQDILERAKTGGVVFHCSAGHDRTGIVAAYIRIKYEHWPVDQAIDEMRRYGHNWRKFSNDGGVSSWQEEHLKAIAKTLN